MSEEIKKVEETQQNTKATELSEADLEQVAGGVAASTGLPIKIKIPPAQ